MDFWWVMPMALLVVLIGSEANLPPLPDKEGFAGQFAGVSNGALLVAGGANFPGKKPWDGGIKVWHDSVFALDKPDGTWQAVGKLPRPLAYGVSVTHTSGVVCVGGSNAEMHYADVFRLEWKDGKLITTELPALPKPLASACGALVGHTLYIAGGQEKPDTSATSSAVYRLDLSATRPKWEEITECPGGGRILAVAAGFDDAFWLVSGIDLVAGTKQRRYLKDAYRYDHHTGWKRIADLPRPVAAAPSPAPSAVSGFYVLGGDDGTQVGVAPDKHSGFARSILRYNPKTDQWIEAGEVASPRVTVPCVAWKKLWVVPSGEVRPGVRSPNVTSFTPAKKE